MLVEQGYIVEAVTNGEEALAAARHRPPDLVLSDIMMPRLDGFGLVRAMRNDPHPDPAQTHNCANCHGAIYREWKQSGHAISAINPKFLHLFAGTDGKSPVQPTWNVQKEHPLGAGVGVDDWVFVIGGKTEIFAGAGQPRLRPALRWRRVST